MTAIERMWMIYTKKLIQYNLKHNINLSFTHHLVQIATRQYGFDSLESEYDVYIDSLKEVNDNVAT